MAVPETYASAMGATPESSPAAETPRLSVKGMSKRYGSTVALAGVDLNVRAGEIHALIGESGSGRSALVRILAGIEPFDSGTMELDGRSFQPRDPSQSHRSGVAFVWQVPRIMPHLSVEENILLGAPGHRAGFTGHGAQAGTAAALMDELGRRGMSPGATAGSLSFVDRRTVEVARGLASGCRLLVMDEPANSLRPDDVERLFSAMKRFCRNGASVLYLTHYAGEARDVADRFTVFRDGRNAGSGDMPSTGAAELAAMSLGGEPASLYRKSPRRTGDIVLSADDVSGVGAVKSADLFLRRGEVLGIAGLTGAGRTELLRIIFSMDRIVRGEVRIGMGSGPASPALRIEQGVGMLSEDRHAEGIAPGLSVADNLTLSRMSAFGPFGLVIPRRQAAAAGKWVRYLGIDCDDVTRSVLDLTCSDMQKVALARLLHHDADILLLDEPTAGMTVTGRADIYRVIDRLACGDREEGLSPRAIIMVSSDLSELMGMCDRIAVMARGVLHPAKPVAEWTEQRLRMAVMGQVAA